ncbi:hypothetical protein [Acutalibacter caecimuris]|nr:hypothetical protein [Acutalibacter sp. M00118]
MNKFTASGRLSAGTENGLLLRELETLAGLSARAVEGKEGMR